MLGEDKVVNKNEHFPKVKNYSKCGHPLPKKAIEENIKQNIEIQFIFLDPNCLS
jgi:isopentenyldiphosphate isomerase